MPFTNALIPSRKFSAKGSQKSVLAAARFVEALGGCVEVIKQIDNETWVICGKVPLEPLTAKDIEKEIDRVVDKILKAAVKLA